ncbi:hypothetical protein LCGC14_1246120 [marine sediment metagenome]|uniref:Uncharacterized protein n=1 Tax=marine sediment metagenome TaxID=412755 RepID=A0A0F9P8B9_9ZZZZ
MSTEAPRCKVCGTKHRLNQPHDLRKKRKPPPKEKKKAWR